MMSKPQSLMPAAGALAILLVGGALIRLAIQRQIAQRRADVERTAEQSAYSLERYASTISTVVDRLTDELTVRNSTADFAALANQSRKPLSGGETFFLLPAASPAHPLQSGGDTPPTDLKDLNWDAATEATSREPVIVGPRRMSSGEWDIFVRSPLFLLNPQGSRSFAGWIAVAVPVGDFLRSGGLDALSSAGLDYTFGYVPTGGKELRTVTNTSSEGLSAPVRQAVRAGDLQWILAISPASGWIPWPLLASEILVALVIALTAFIVLNDLVRRPAKLAMEIEDRDRRLREAHHRLAEETRQREELEQRFTEATFHDSFTGLPNRSFLIARLSRALNRSRLEPGYVMAVVILHFGRFRNIVDTLGAAVGDQLLTQAVRRLESRLRPEDSVVARVADDEFATLLFDIGTPQAAAAAAKRIYEALAAPFQIEGRSVFATARMGIALSSDGYEDAEELVHSAQIALSQAAPDGPAPYAVFDPATREQLVTRHQLETDLHQALERDEFRLFFQPIVSLQSGSIAGAEVLIRWQHPLEGLLAPARFIPLAEESGLVVPITRWVLRHACEQGRRWKNQFPADLNFYLSVNLSAQDLRQPDLCEYVAGVIEHTGLPPGVLRFEVTESMMIGNLNAISELVDKFHSMGIPLLLDDFGTGYSSLSYLNRFHFDYIKIDRSFVSRLGGANQNAGIVKTIIHLAQDIGSNTVAEGVESGPVADLLRDLGCDYAQGYYFSKPADVESAERLLLSRPSWQSAPSLPPAAKS